MKAAPRLHKHTAADAGAGVLPALRNVVGHGERPMPPAVPAPWGGAAATVASGRGGRPRSATPRHQPGDPPPQTPGERDGYCMSEASFLIPIPIAEYVTVFRAIPGIVATMLPSHLSRLDNEQSRESIVTAADLALIHQVAGAALLPEEHRKSIIRRALHSLLYHVQPMLKPA